MVLNQGALDGRRSLSQAGMERMLANQIGSLPIPCLKTVAPPLTANVELFPGRRKSHSMAFMRFEEDIPSMRSAGSRGWAGVLNSRYLFDPQADVCAVLMTPSLPFCEPRFMSTYQQLEQATYRQAAGIAAAGFPSPDGIMEK